MPEGWSEADVLANYPGITHEDVIACLAYAGYGEFREGIP